MKGNYTNIIDLQIEFSKKVITHDYLNNNNNIQNVCGIDLSYKDLNAFCSAVIVNKKYVRNYWNCKWKKYYQLSIHSRTLYVERRRTFAKNCKIIEKCIWCTLDGHGILHPRQCGLASYVGIMIDKPTIGVSKNLLCGSILGSSYVEYNKTILGYTIKKIIKKNLC